MEGGLDQWTRGYRVFKISLRLDCWLSALHRAWRQQRLIRSLAPKKPVCFEREAYAISRFRSLDFCRGSQHVTLLLPSSSSSGDGSAFTQKNHSASQHRCFGANCHNFFIESVLRYKPVCGKPYDSEAYLSRYILILQPRSFGSSTLPICAI